jgi:hypothetical protein
VSRPVAGASLWFVGVINILSEHQLESENGQLELDARVANSSNGQLSEHVAVLREKVYSWSKVCKATRTLDKIMDDADKRDASMMFIHRNGRVFWLAPGTVHQESEYDVPYHPDTETGKQDFGFLWSYIDQLENPASVDLAGEALSAQNEQWSVDEKEETDTVFARNEDLCWT